MVVLSALKPTNDHLILHLLPAYTQCVLQFSPPGNGRGSSVVAGTHENKMLCKLSFSMVALNN